MGPAGPAHIVLPEPAALQPLVGDNALPREPHGGRRLTLARRCTSSGAMMPEHRGRHAHHTPSHPDGFPQEFHSERLLLKVVATSRCPQSGHVLLGANVPRPVADTHRTSRSM